MAANFQTINALAAMACGIAPQREGWHSYDTVPAPTTVREPLSPESDTAIEVANSAIKLLRLFQRDVRSGCLVAAEHDRKQAVELVSRALATAWFAAFEAQYGPAPICPWCGMVESIDCRCPEDDGREEGEVF